MFEYKEMAKYYDLFYYNKSYEKEVNFLENLIGNKGKIVLDVGCGTGIHMSLLEEKGYHVDGLDLNNGMLDIAKNRVNGNLYEGNLLDYNINKTYDVIISMFAVFNHLKNYNEFEKGLLHWYNHLSEDGILVIDLHNGRSNGKKENSYKNYRRIMVWNFDVKTFKEHTDITYEIDGNKYCDSHEFLIYKIDKIKNILDRNKLKYQLYGNYSSNEATNDSKNIEIVIKKRN